MPTLLDGNKIPNAAVVGRVLADSKPFDPTAACGSLGAAPEEATREVGVAIAHAVLSGAASLLGQPYCENDHSPSGGTRPADTRSSSRTRYQV